MGDASKFQNIFIYYSLNVSLLCFILSEIFIFFYTYQKNNNHRAKLEKDKGTKWLLYINCIVCIAISFLFVSRKAPLFIRARMLPNIFSYVGVLFVLVGIIIRIFAVLSLKRAFTLNVQITNTQDLVTSGLYSRIRHPAYTGSIISLLGIALSLRNIIAVVVVFLFCLICYSIRIRIEEIALIAHFQKEFTEYTMHTYKLFPYIW